MKNKKVLIVGAAGSIGGALSRRVAEFKPKSLTILDQNESELFWIWEETKETCKTNMVIADIRNRERIEEIFLNYRPDIVYHCAAYKHVILMEMWPQEAHRTNVHGTQVIVDAALKSGVDKVVFISTDKAVNPTSVMGMTKKEGEKICLNANKLKKTKFIVVRFGNVMASRGSVIPIFQKQINEGKHLTVTDQRMERYFMGIYEAVDLVLEASMIGKAGDIMVLDMGNPMPIYELANLMVKLSGKNLRVNFTKAGKGEKFFEELMTPAERKRAIKRNGIYIIRSKSR